MYSGEKNVSGDGISLDVCEMGDVDGGRQTSILVAKRGLRQRDPIWPLLFVLIMEYLSRCLRRLKGMPEFIFHPKCEKLSISSLLFADGLLFARGDKISVKLMMKQFGVFSNSTGLQVSKEKRCAYFGGVSDNGDKEIIYATGFCKGTLHFKYLGGR